MKGKIIASGAAGLLVCFTLVAATVAQEGHPMTGSWVGDWGPTPQERNRVVVIIDWTGTELVGVINPGPNAIPIRTATADPSDWSLHIEAEGVDAQGRPVRYVVDGTIDDLQSYNRTLAGTWNVGDTNGDFSITRQ